MFSGVEKLDECEIANALTEADYSSKVGLWEVIDG
jgi:hypothetical protein